MSKLIGLVKNKYSLNFLWTFLEKIINLTSVLLIGIFLARYLGPEHYGILTYSQSYVGMFGFLISLGLDNITIREVIKKEEDSNLIISTAFILKLVAYVFIALIINSFSYFSNDTTEIKLIVFIVSLGLIQQPFNVFVNYFQAIVNIKYISLVVMISKVVLIITKLLLIYYKASLVSFVVLDSLIFFLLAFFYFLHYKSYTSLKTSKIFHFDNTYALSMLKDSWPLMISSGAIMLYMRLDQIMIKEMLSLEELGYYSIGVKMAESWYFIPMIITSVLFPAILKARSVDLSLYNERLKSVFFVTSWIGIAFSAFLFFFSEYLIQFLFGAQYANSHESLSILSLAGVFVSMGYVNGKWMVAENYTKLSLYRNVLGMIVNLCCNFILIPKYGINGAAFSTLFAIFVASNLFFLFNKKTRSIFYIQNTALFNFKSIKKIF